VFYATVGLHPESAQDLDFTTSGSTLQDLEILIQENRDVIVAVGECGFDFHYLDGTYGGRVPFDRVSASSIALSQIENQKNWWRVQFELAQKYSLPLIIHTRDARDATLEYMKTENITRAVMHCFSEDLDFARELMDFSTEIYFSFSGIVTYKKSEKIQEAAKNIPLDRILVETDAPFLAPQPVRGSVNEPAYTRYNLDKIAELR
jgi:TatD DNase family protein